ncbi:hypothetical protein [Candidatus Thiosymbion oneisti]|uniref:hypothetical protein n=1 Tax=Candidatus Thiosymbion oneisti TaxID=589554 RepID=UPI0010602303|nr:hypothetical protein [Candidatus Thiosymbion oneisti]
MTTDLTTEILKQIRDGITELREDFNHRLDQTNSRLEELRQDFNHRLDQTNSRLGRVEQGLNDLGKFMRQIALDQAKHERFHVHHVERLEEDVTDLKARVQRLEQRTAV